jgi:STE24 endopeptidase
MKTADGWTLFFLGLLVLRVLTQWLLILRQVRHIHREQAQVPADFADTLSLEAHQKAAQYSLAKLRFSLLSIGIETVLVLLWTVLGGLALMNTLITYPIATSVFTGHSVPAWYANPWGLSLAWVGLFVIVNYLLGLPLAWYEQFVLEARFGFNTMTLRLWWQDQLKAALLGLLLGLPLLVAVIAFMQVMGSWWWLWTFVVWIGFQGLLLWAYPRWIAPWFNRFETLPDRELKDRVRRLMEKTGLEADGFFVMDGSRRSRHANAYFTGLGRNKRVVFFDTLLQSLTPEEIEAVLAHEIGHFKHRHLLKRLVGLGTVGLVVLAILGYLSGQAWFYEGLGLPLNHLWPIGGGQSMEMFVPPGLTLISLGIAVPVLTWWITPIINCVSRRHEYQADAFSVAQTGTQALPRALLKLYESNASFVSSDKWYSAFHASHPPALSRIKHIRSLRAW